MAAPPALLQVPPDITFLTAPQLLGVMFNWGLWGILTVQVFIYYLCFEDRPLVQCLVYGLYLLECLQTALSTWDAFHWFCQGFGDLAILSNPLASPYDSPCIDAIISLFVQLFFCWRIYVLGKSKIIAGFIAIISVAQALAGITTGIRAGIINDLVKIRGVLTPELTVWLGGAALADALIAVTMTILLLSSHGNMKSSDLIIQRIITLTIETNALSASVAILALVLFITSPKYPLFLCPPYVLGKLYTNTLLAVFNNRVVMNRETHVKPATHLRALQQQTNVGTTSMVAATRSRHIEISVTRDFGNLDQDRPYKNSQSNKDF